MYGCPLRDRNSRMRRVPGECVDPMSTTSPNPRAMSFARRRMKARMKISLSSTSVCTSARSASRATSSTTPVSSARTVKYERRPESMSASPVNCPGQCTTITVSPSSVWQTISPRPSTIT